ncbi:MAG: pyridoxine 5'-phosphate synthase [Desulfobacterales bacterium]|nr:pyridoxine 5'-phosphate synthase [Desulfobacterales bacterium]MCP4163052.1 pyridoxine 5'-phosphate synthase [Deltaproteobacteria bacterium]
MSELAVNVDHIATLREARKINYPDPVIAAGICELAGVDGIVCHLREDRRHIQDRDVKLLREVVQTRLILEMAATEEMLNIALSIMPDVVTLVPEKRVEVTTEGGLDLTTSKGNIAKAVDTLKNSGIKVCIFIDPDPEQIQIAHKIGTDSIEIHTGAYCEAKTEVEKDKTFAEIVNAANFGKKLSIGVNAGHGLCYNNIKRFKGHDLIQEFSIGHSIISRAAFVGLERAVKEMYEIVKDL